MNCKKSLVLITHLPEVYLRYSEVWYSEGKCKYQSILCGSPVVCLEGLIALLLQEVEWNASASRHLLTCTHARFRGDLSFACTIIMWSTSLHAFYRSLPVSIFIVYLCTPHCTCSRACPTPPPLHTHTHIHLLFREFQPCFSVPLNVTLPFIFSVLHGIQPMLVRLVLRAFIQLLAVHEQQSASTDQVRVSVHCHSALKHTILWKGSCDGKKKNERGMLHFKLVNRQEASTDNRTTFLCCLGTLFACL